MQTLMQDVRFALRTLRKNLGFTVAALITLALAIGANTAIFSVVNAVMLRPMPFPHSEQLFGLRHSYPKLGMKVVIDPGSFDYYRKNTQAFEALAAFSPRRAPQNMSQGTGAAERVTSIKATADFFRVLGVSPRMGRVFSPDEDQPGKDRVVVLSEALWRSRFAADPRILEKSVLLDGAEYKIIGVMPASATFPADAALWLPMAFTPQDLQSGPEYLDVIGRRKADVTAAQVQKEMQRITAEVIRQSPSLAKYQWSVVADELQKMRSENVRAALLVLLGAVLCVLLIGAANVANLLLTRAVSRQREIAVRRALGASDARLLRQLLVEGSVLSLLGAALGLAVGTAMVRVLLAIAPNELLSSLDVGLDLRVLAFTLGVALLSGFIFGIVPALQARRAHLHDVLKDATSSAGPRRRGMRELLATVEVAVALVLLIGAGLMIKSFVRIQEAGVGFTPDHVLTARIALTRERYPTPQAQAAFYGELLRKVESLPGVTSAALGSSVPLNGDEAAVFTVEGREFATRPHAFDAAVSPDYFSTLKLPVLRGRTFSDADRDGAPLVAVIDDNVARAFFAGEDPVGKRLTLFNSSREIVGVVSHVRHNSPLGEETKGEIYLPSMQAPRGFMQMIMRSRVPPESLTNMLRAAVASLDSQQAVFDVRTMDEVVDTFVAQPRFNMTLLAAFATLALLLAVVGIYGVISYAVTQRTREIGVRMALGARRADVARMVLQESLNLAGLGLVVGMLAAFAATRALTAMLYGVKTWDPATFAMLPLLLLVVALLAAYIPARRAAKVEPMTALRYE